MKIFICVLCLATVGSEMYPGDIKMERLGIVTTEFSLHLHQKTLLSDKNSVFSAVSAHMMMTNAVLGASGATLIEMNDVLNLTRFTGGQQKPHEAYTNLREQYSTNITDGKVLLAIGIYVNPNAPFVQKFANNTITYYAPDLSAIDLTNPVQKVNDYFKTKTGGRIQNIVKPGDIDNSSKIVLVSAGTVVTQWAKPFLSNKTKQGIFYTSSKTLIQIDFLNDEYHRDIKLKQNFNGADFVELPCRGNRYSLVFLVPQSTSSLAEQEASFTAANTTKELFKGLTAAKYILSVPKVRIESTFELSPAFKALGMVKAFDPNQGDFTAMSKTGGNCISKHFHKAVFEINENGTADVTAAVPSVANKPSILESLLYPTITINRPFLMFFRDNQYGITLLQGKYTGK